MRASTSTKELLMQLVDEIKQVNQRLDSLIEINSNILKSPKASQRIVNVESQTIGQPNVDADVMSLLSLPMSMRKTVMALYKLEKATAEELAEKTQRLRGVESALANQLVRMGYLRKKREGRQVYFYIEQPMGVTE